MPKRAEAGERRAVAGERHVAVYVRVSSSSQDHRSQVPDLERCIAATAEGEPVRWYRDTASGRGMDRPGWRALERELRAGAVSRIVVWRLDRLGRTAAGLTALFAELRSLRVSLTSQRDGFDLATPSGRMFATLLAGIAEYETEVRGERQAAGIAAAKAAGKTWGGRRPGARWKVTAELERQVLRMASDGEPVATIARLFDLSRTTVYRILESPTSDPAASA